VNRAFAAGLVIKCVMTTGGLFGLVAMHMLYRAHFWKGRGQGETSISTHTMGQWYNATMGQRDR